MSEEDPLNECPICMEPLHKSLRTILGCCSIELHTSCYMKTLPKCPFCRTVQPAIFPIIQIKTDWPRIVKTIGICIIISACITVSGTLNMCDC